MASKIAAKKYTEKELVSALYKKDHSAFSYLYDHYSGSINGVIYRLVKNKELSGDILQEVFVRIWKNFSTYDESSGRLFTWIIALARNLTIDLLSSPNYKIHLQGFADNYSEVNKNCFCELEKFDALQIEKYPVRLLDAEDSKLIDLAYFRGMTQVEISQFMCIPLGSVKIKIRSAIQRLRKELA